MIKFPFYSTNTALPILSSSQQTRNELVRITRLESQPATSATRHKNSPVDECSNPELRSRISGSFVIRSLSGSGFLRRSIGRVHVRTVHFKLWSDITFIAFPRLWR